MKNKVTLIGNIVQVGAGLMFISSFFVSDNKKATSRRWASLGVFAAGWGIQIAGNVMAHKKSTLKKH